MLERGWAERPEIDGIHARIQQELEEALAWAEQSPYPDKSTLLDGVYGKP
jgi:pyruvate dehydrogenase E1 component alpha subunit